MHTKWVQSLKILVTVTVYGYRSSTTDNKSFLVLFACSSAKCFRWQRVIHEKNYHEIQINLIVIQLNYLLGSNAFTCYVCPSKNTMKKSVQSNSRLRLSSLLATQTRALKRFSHIVFFLFSVDFVSFRFIHSHCRNIFHLRASNYSNVRFCVVIFVSCGWKKLYNVLWITISGQSHQILLNNNNKKTSNKLEI